MPAETSNQRHQRLARQARQRRELHRAIQRMEPHRRQLHLARNQHTRKTAFRTSYAQDPEFRRDADAFQRNQRLLRWWNALALSQVAYDTIVTMPNLASYAQALVARLISVSTQTAISITAAFLAIVLWCITTIAKRFTEAHVEQAQLDVADADSIEAARLRRRIWSKLALRIAVIVFMLGFVGLSMYFEAIRQAKIDGTESVSLTAGTVAHISLIAIAFVLHTVLLIAPVRLHWDGPGAAPWSPANLDDQIATDEQRLGQAAAGIDTIINDAEPEVQATLRQRLTLDENRWINVVLGRDPGTGPAPAVPENEIPPTDPAPAANPPPARPPAEAEPVGANARNNLNDVL